MQTQSKQYPNALVIITERFLLLDFLFYRRAEGGRLLGKIDVPEIVIKVFVALIGTQFAPSADVLLNI